MEKTKTASEVTDWREADRALLDLADCRRKAERARADAEETIACVKDDLEKETAGYRAREKELLAVLEAFARDHEDELDGRSKKLTHGTVGFRKTTKLALRCKVATVLQKLRARGLSDCIRVKETLNREALSAYDDDVLRAVGARRKREDRFYAETPEVELP